uniref:Uncharacterized protein n=2 Tax=Francisella tularensis TaxID=263 RepID=V5T9A7_FRANO|nr:hypothetical protein N894_0034 [Francisella tularensis subsp. novicida PA10-7858]
MANSNSPHSKSLRMETARKWRKENTVQKVYVANINNPEDVENLEILENIEGGMVEKFREIFRVYKKYKGEK